MELSLIVMAVSYLIICPFTKVEESFNLQAVHDLIFHKTNLAKYDHFEFPGVVPRTFIGPAFLSSAAFPFAMFFEFFKVNKFYIQYVVRGILGYFVLWSFQRYCSSVKKEFGQSVAAWLVLVTLTQFHFIYYLSRPLPNIFALIFVLLSYHYWLEGDHSMFIRTSGIAVLVFRFEVSILLGIILLMELCSRRLGVLFFLKHAVPAGILIVAINVLVDSFFWKRILWPELQVIYFNLYLNKSSEWGTSPFLWYFYSAIPRAMGSSIVFLPLGMYLDRRIKLITFPAVAFVAIYSLLPHKELRFIIYVFPIFNLAVAKGCHYIFQRCTKSRLNQMLLCVVAGHICVNLCLTSMLLYISHINYPGGLAMQRLHELEPPTAHVNVHIDVYSAQTGVSRFLELNPNWRYNKSEAVVPGSVEMLAFTHLLVEGTNRQSPAIRAYQGTHDILDAISCFSHVSFNYLAFPPVQVYTKTCLFILKRKDGIQAKVFHRRRMESKSA